MLNQLDVFFLGMMVAFVLSIVFLFIGFWMGRKTQGEKPIAEILGSKKKTGTRDEGNNPFTDNLKPIGSEKRIATIKE